MGRCVDCLHIDVCVSMFRDVFLRAPTVNEIRAPGQCPFFKDRTKWEDRKHGRWLDYMGDVKCPFCDFECTDTYYLGKAVSCPNCGAEMDGGNEE